MRFEEDVQACYAQVQAAAKRSVHVAEKSGIAAYPNELKEDMQLSAAKLKDECFFCLLSPSIFIYLLLSSSISPLIMERGGGEAYHLLNNSKVNLQPNSWKLPFRKPVKAPTEK